MAGALGPQWQTLAVPPGVEENATMIRSRQVRTLLPQLAAVLAVALALGPARSQETGLKSDDAKRVVDLLDKIEKRLATMEARSDVTMDLVNKDLRQLRDESARL